MSANGGGPAFPAKQWIDSDSPNARNPILYTGMSLRDYAAIQFHAALISNVSATGDSIKKMRREFAEEALAQAEAFIAARSKP